MKGIRTYSTVFERARQAYAEFPTGLMLGQKDLMAQLRENMEQADCSLIRLLMNEGYFSYAPHISHHYVGSSTSLATPTRDGWGHIVLAMDKRARVNLPMGCHHEHRPTQAVFDRWFSLLHEAAHCEFEFTRVCFNPSVALSQPEHEALNRWVFHPVFRTQARSTLNEAFADTYACMMLLRQAAVEGADPQAVVQQLILFRQTMASEDRNSILSKNKPIAMNKVSPYLACATAVRLAVERQEEWIKAPARDVFDHAVGCASDALVELIASTQGTPIGVALNEDLAGMPQYSTLFGSYGVEVIERTHDSFLTTLTNIHGTHPGWAYVQRVLRESSQDIAALSGSTADMVERFAQGHHDNNFHEWVREVGQVVHAKEMQADREQWPELMDMTCAWMSDLSLLDQARNRLYPEPAQPSSSSDLRRALTP